MADPSPTITDQDLRPAGRRWTRLERATLYGLGGSALIHLLIVLIAALVTVRFNFGDAGGSAGEEGVEFAVLNDASLAQDNSPVLQTERTAVQTSLSDSPVRLDLLADRAEDRSVDDLSESIAPALDPGGGGLTSLDPETGSAGAGSGEGSSFFGLEAKGRRFAYIVDISGSMNSPGNNELTRWELTRAELARSIRALEPETQFHIQLFSSGSQSLFGVASWSQSSPSNKRLTSDALAIVSPNGGTEPLPGFEAVFSLDPKADAIYFMSDGEVADGPAFAAALRQLNGRRPVPIHCILFGDAGGGDALRRVEAMMKNISAQSGGRYLRVGTLGGGGRP